MVNQFTETKNVLLTTKDQLLIDNFTEVAEPFVLKGESWTLDGKNIFVVSETESLYRSGDGGVTWIFDQKGEMGRVFDIFGISDTEIYAGGEYSVVKSNGNGSWTRVSKDAIPNNTYTYIYGIWGTAATYMFGCGLIYNPLYNPPWDYTEMVHTYDGFDSLSGWAVLAIENVKDYRLHDIWGFSPVPPSYNDYIVSVGYKYGTPNQGLIMYAYVDYNPDYDYYYWQQVEWAVFDDTTGLNSIWASADESIWLSVGNGGKIKKLSGGVWYDIPSGYANNLLSVWGTPDGAVIYALGDIVLKSTDRGETWSKLNDAPGGNAVWVRGENDVYSAGTRIYHYDGASWTPMCTSTEMAGETLTFNCYTIWGYPTGNKVYAGGIGGRIYEYETEKSATVKQLPRSASKAKNQESPERRVLPEKIKEAIKKHSSGQTGTKPSCTRGSLQPEKVRNRGALQQKEMRLWLNGGNSETSR